MLRYLPLAAALLLIVPASGAQTKKKDVGDRTSYFRDIVIQADESANDAVCYDCSVRVLGEVRDDVVAFDGDIELDGNVGDDALAFGGRVRTGPEIQIGDEADAFGGRVELGEDAKAVNGVQFVPYLFVPGQLHPPLRGIEIVAGFHLFFVFLFAWILRERSVENIFKAMHEKKGWVILWGAVGWGVAFLLFEGCYRLSETRLGNWGMIVSGGIVFLVIAATVNSGLTGLSVWLGRAFSQNPGWLKAILIGSIVILALEAVPRAGFPVFAVAAWLSMGAALVSRFGSRPREVKRTFAPRY